MTGSSRQRLAFVILLSLLLTGGLVYGARRVSGVAAVAQTRAARARQARQRTRAARNRRGANSKIQNPGNQNAAPTPTPTPISTPTPTPSPTPTFTPTPTPTPSPIKIDPQNLHLSLFASWLWLWVAVPAVVFLLLLSVYWLKGIKQYHVLWFLIVIIALLLLTVSGLVAQRAYNSQLEREVNQRVETEQKALLSQQEKQKKEDLDKLISSLKESLPTEKRPEVDKLQQLLSEVLAAPTPSPTAAPSASPNPSPVVTLNPTSGFEISRESVKFTNLPPEMILTIFIISLIVGIVAALIYYFKKSPAPNNNKTGVWVTTLPIALAVGVVCAGLLFGFSLYLRYDANKDMEGKVGELENQLNQELKADRVRTLLSSRNRTPDEQIDQLSNIVQTALPDKKAADETLAILNALKQSVQPAVSPAVPAQSPAPAQTPAAPASSPTPCPTPCVVSFVPLPVASPSPSPSPDATRAGESSSISLTTILAIVLGFALLRSLEVILSRYLSASRDKKVVSNRKTRRKPDVNSSDKNQDDDRQS